MHFTICQPQVPLHGFNLGLNQCCLVQGSEWRPGLFMARRWGVLKSHNRECVCVPFLKTAVCVCVGSEDNGGAVNGGWKACTWPEAALYECPHRVVLCLSGGLRSRALLFIRNTRLLLSVWGRPREQVNQNAPSLYCATQKQRTLPSLQSN